MEACGAACIMYCGYVGALLLEHRLAADERANHRNPGLCHRHVGLASARAYVRLRRERGRPRTSPNT